MDHPEPPDFTAIERKKVEETIEKIDAAPADNPIDKKVKQKLNYAKRNWPENLVFKTSKNSNNHKIYP